MKAGHVAQLVGAVADAMAAQHKAAQVMNDTHGLRLRVEALENLVTVISEVLLAGTSADPATPAPKPAAIKSGNAAAKKVRK